MRVAVAGWHSLISVMDVNWYRVYWGAIQNTYYVKCLRKWNKLDSKDQVVLFFLFIWSISFTLICLSIPQIRCVSLCECLTIYPLISSVFGKDFFTEECILCTHSCTLYCLLCKVLGNEAVLFICYCPVCVIMCTMCHNQKGLLD